MHEMEKAEQLFGEDCISNLHTLEGIEKASDGDFVTDATPILFSM